LAVRFAVLPKVPRKEMGKGLATCGKCAMDGRKEDKVIRKVKEREENIEIRNVSQRERTGNENRKKGDWLPFNVFLFLYNSFQCLSNALQILLQQMAAESE
jgi:hypothetical protein